MKTLSPVKMMVLAFGLLLFGIIIPFLTVTGRMQPGFALLFLSHFASLFGVILGLIGAAFYARERRR